MSLFPATSNNGVNHTFVEGVFFFSFFVLRIPLLRGESGRSSEEEPREELTISGEVESPQDEEPIKRRKSKHVSGVGEEEDVKEEDEELRPSLERSGGVTVIIESS